MVRGADELPVICSRLRKKNRTISTNNRWERRRYRNLRIPVLRNCMNLCGINVKREGTTPKHGTLTPHKSNLYLTKSMLLVKEPLGVSSR